MSELRKYGASATVLFDLYQVDGVDFEPAATFAAGDIKLMKDEGVEANTTNLPTDEGQGYSLVLTATEMQAARLKVYVVDQTATKVWLDTSVNIDTYGHASAQHAFDLDAASAAQTGDSYARLGAAGASLTDLGGMSTAMKAEVNAEADTALTDYDPPTNTEMNARTLAAASYATSTEVQAIQNNTRTTIAVPGVMERPDSGATRFKIYLNNYDTTGSMEAPDSAPTVTVSNEEGTTRAGNLQHPTTHVPGATMVNIDVGRYWIEYDLDNADAMEGLVFTFSVIEGGVTRKFDRVAQVVDTTAVDFTAADRTKLNTLHDTRLTAARATNLDNLDNPISTAQSDLDKLTGADGAVLATSQPNYAPNKTTPPTAAQNRIEMDSSSTELSAIKGRLPAALTGAGNMKSDQLATDGSTSAAANLKRATLLNQLGTVTSGTNTTLVSDIVVTKDDQLKGAVIVFALDTTTVALRGERTNITACTAATNTLTFTALAGAGSPVSGDTFELI